MSDSASNRIEIAGLAHIGIRVADFACSAAFYRRFGFEVTRADHAEHVFVLTHRGGLVLNLLDSADDDNRGRNVLMDERPRFPGVTHIALVAADVGRARRQVEAAGCSSPRGR